MSQYGHESSPEDVQAVVIHAIGSQKISAIKLLRQMTGLGLKDAKDLAERPTPFVLVVCAAPLAREFQTLAQSEGLACELRDPLPGDQPAITNAAQFGLQTTGGSGCAGAACLLLLCGGGMLGMLAWLV